MAYVVVGGMSVYSHFFAGFVLVAHLCSVPFVPEADRPSVRRLAGVYCSIAVIAIPRSRRSPAGRKRSW